MLKVAQQPSTALVKFIPLLQSLLFQQVVGASPYFVDVLMQELESLHRLELVQLESFLDAQCIAGMQCWGAMCCLDVMTTMQAMQ
jgi:hypothetical protein